MALGFEDEHPVMVWRWLPVAPPPLDQPLPPRRHRNDAAFRAALLPETELTAFRRSFQQLARETPDLHFYRLIQTFNTPLLSVSSRDGGRSGFALWGGAIPQFRDQYRFAYLWFFHDGVDGDEVAVEFGFDGGLTLWSRLKSDGDLAKRYEAICHRANRL